MATNTTTSVRIYPVGTLIPVNVLQSDDFPPFSYVLITDGIYAISGIVTAAVGSLLSVRINSIISGSPGVQINGNAIVTFAGPPGPTGTTNVGDFGTIVCKDLAINPPVSFASAQVSQYLNNPNTISSLVFTLPNNQIVSYRVIAEFSGNVVTNQTVPASSSMAYVGILSTAAQNALSTSGTFVGYGEPNQAGPIINSPIVVADGSCIVNTATANGNPSVYTKFIGTFNQGTQLDFTVVAAAQQLNTTYYVSGILEVKCYPIYS